MANTPRRDIARFISDGVVEVLGGFDQIPPSTNPGWILHVISKNKKEYNIAVTMDEKNRWLTVWIACEIPWEEYNGKPNRGFWCIYDGDKPLEYLLKKVRAIRGRKKEISKT
jgi:hypothetical protein